MYDYAHMFLCFLPLFCFVGCIVYLCIMYIIYFTDITNYIQRVHSRTLAGSHVANVRPDLAKKKSELIKQQNEFKVSLLFRYSMVILLMDKMRVEYDYGNIWMFPKIMVPPNHPF